MLFNLIIYNLSGKVQSCEFIWTQRSCVKNVFNCFLLDSTDRNEIRSSDFHFLRSLPLISKHEMIFIKLLIVQLNISIYTFLVCLFVCLYNKTRQSYIYMFSIAGQTAGRKFFVDTHGWPGGDISLKKSKKKFFFEN